MPFIYDKTSEWESSFFNEGFARIRLNNKWGLVNKNGIEVVPCMYDYLHHFNEGFVIVKIDGYYGYIDSNGNVIIPAKYESAKDFSDGLAAVKLNGKWGFINTEGKVTIAFKYKNIIDNFKNGIARVTYTKFDFFSIDKSGNCIKDCRGQ